MHRTEIPRFPNNKRIAVTFSFDDGVVTDLPLLEKLNAWDLKATFNLNSGLLDSGRHQTGNTTYLSSRDVAKSYAGHEVAIHTVTHPHLDRLDRSAIAREVLEDRRALEDLIGYPVRGMAYPYGTYNDTVIDVLRALDIVYARTVATATQPFPPPNPLALATTCHQFDPSLLTKWNDWYNSTWFPQDGGVFFVWGHSYEFHLQNDWAALERLFRPLAHKPDIWYCTNIELFDYERARQSLQLGANGRCAFNPSALSVTILINNAPREVPPGATITWD